MSRSSGLFYCTDTIRSDQGHLLLLYSYAYKVRDSLLYYSTAKVLAYSYSYATVHTPAIPWLGAETDLCVSSGWLGGGI